MNARLIKETRALLPMFAGTLPLIIVPQLIWPLAGFGLVALGVACVVMAGSAFGNEFQYRTISLLLSQPIPRSVLWREKMLVLGAGLVTSLAVLMGCMAVSGPVRENAEWLVLILIPLCAFCGAPFWTLELRQSIGGMVATVGIPCGLLAVYALVAEQLGGTEPFALISAIVFLLLIYCVLVYSLGYAKFKRLEAVDIPSRDLSLPAGVEAILVAPLTKISSRFRGPFASLLKKEFRLQQISFLLAGVFILIAVAGFCLHPRYPEVATGIVGGDMVVYMLILPLIAGAISVGEERGWGMAEWQLTLPPSALKQWSAKMVASLSTSLFLGLLLPGVIFLAVDSLLFHRGSGASSPPASAVAVWVLSQLLVTSTAAYGASFSRNTLRGILAAFAILAVAATTPWLAIYCVHHLVLASIVWLGHPRVVADLMLPLLPLAMGLMLYLLQWLAWSNFRRSGPTAGWLVAQLAVLFVSVWLIVWVFFSALYYLQRI